MLTKSEKSCEGRNSLDRYSGTLAQEKKNTGKDAGEYELMIIPQGAQQLQGTAELQVHCEQSAITQRCLI